MYIDKLKLHAKRLRSSLSKLHNIEITHSIALELVAQQNNFPTWDAASGASRKNRDPMTFIKSSGFYNIWPGIKNYDYFFREALSVFTDANETGFFIASANADSDLETLIEKLLVSLEKSPSPRNIYWHENQSIEKPIICGRSFEPWISRDYKLQNSEAENSIVVMSDIKDHDDIERLVNLCRSGVKVLVLMKAKSAESSYRRLNFLAERNESFNIDKLIRLTVSAMHYSPQNPALKSSSD